MLTEKQKEIAARELCRKRGVDPDSLIGHSPAPDKHGFVPGVLINSPAWKFTLYEIEKQEEIQWAIDFALGHKP